MIANHVTSYDAALILYALPRTLRDRVAIAMSGEMLMEFRDAKRRQNIVLRLLGPAAYLLMTTLFNVSPPTPLKRFPAQFYSCRRGDGS